MTVTEEPAVRVHDGERKWVGQSIRRVEDPKFLLGKGGYIDDMRMRGMLHAAPPGDEQQPATDVPEVPERVPGGEEAPR